VGDSGTDVILNLTTGMGGDYVPDESDPARAGAGTDLVPPLVRLEHIEALRPGLCSLDCGTMNFGASVFMNTPAHLEQMAARIREPGGKPEPEVFELGPIRFAKELIARGLVDPPPLFELCLGIPWGAPADLPTLLAMREALPAEALWSAFGIGREQFPMVTQAVLLGGNVRVGLEDNLYLARGRLATNAELVARAVEIIGRLGRGVASASTARQRLGIPRRSRMCCAIAPGLGSLDPRRCSANLPVGRLTFVACPGPELIQAQASASSSPDSGLVQPPGGNWSVSVSAYSCAATRENASSTPCVPELMNFTPQLRPASLT